MFFQNVLYEEFRDSWPIDQQARFSIGGNPNNIANAESFNADLFDFSTNNTLTVNVALDPEMKGYTAIAVNVAGADPANTYAYEVVALLNANILFSDVFTATIKTAPSSMPGVQNYRVIINPKKQRQTFRYYFSNSSAEIELQFNHWAKVVELPSYFDRDTIDNRFTFEDSAAQLIRLNPGDPIDADIITAAGLDPLSPKADWELLAGRSNTHTFQKIEYDGSGRIVQTIEYFAGAVAGDLAKFTQYVYVGAATTPAQITVIPYTLTDSDLVMPP